MACQKGRETICNVFNEDTLHDLKYLRHECEGLIYHGQISFIRLCADMKTQN